MSSKRLLVLDAGGVGVRELVDQAQLGRATQDRRKVHLLQHRVAVAHAPAGNHLQALGQSGRLGATVGLQIADHDIAAGLRLGMPLLQHPVGLAHAGGHPEEDLVTAAARLRSSRHRPAMAQPLPRDLWRVLRSAKLLRPGGHLGQRIAEPSGRLLHADRVHAPAARAIASVLHVEPLSDRLQRDASARRGRCARSRARTRRTAASRSFAIPRASTGAPERSAREIERISGNASDLLAA